MGRDELIRDIKKLLSDTQQTQLFGEEVHYTHLESLFKEFLEQSGYLVLKVVKSPLKITKERDLIEYFYAMLNLYSPGLLRPDELVHRDRDLSLAKFMVKNRMEKMGCSKETALQICAEIITYLIKFEDYYRLSYPVTGFNVFNKKSIDWLYNRTQIIKENPYTYSVDKNFDKDVERFTEKAIQEYGEDYFSFDLEDDYERRD